MSKLDEETYAAFKEITGSLADRIEAYDQSEIEEVASYAHGATKWLCAMNGSDYRDFNMWFDVMELAAMLALLQARHNREPVISQKNPVLQEMVAALYAVQRL